MRKRLKIETIGQYLARGGRIEQVPQGVSGDRGGTQSLNIEEMAAKRKHRQSDVHLCQPNETRPRYKKV